MIAIGVDSHMATHCCVAVDGNQAGRKVGERTVPATDAGHAAALQWARTKFRGEEITFGMEDARHVSGRLERFLVASGMRCVRVPTALMYRTRGSLRERGKSDPIDAYATAQAVLREDDLPIAVHDSASRELKLLVDRRDALVHDRNAFITRLRWRVHEVDPERHPGYLTSASVRNPLRSWLTEQPGLVAELAVEEIDDIARLTTSINTLEKRITTRVAVAAPALLAMPGCGALTAAKIVGETALVTRFKSEAAFARFAGVAPVPNWSGKSAGRMRRGRYGNRELNRAIHRIALTQLRLDGLGRVFFDKRTGEGDSAPEALRALKRRLARVVFGHLHADLRLRSPEPAQPDAATA